MSHCPPCPSLRYGRYVTSYDRRILNCPPNAWLYKSITQNVLDKFWIVSLDRSKAWIGFGIHAVYEDTRCINSDTHRNNVFQFWYGTVSMGIHARIVALLSSGQWGRGYDYTHPPAPMSVKPKHGCFSPPAAPTLYHTPIGGT